MWAYYAYPLSRLSGLVTGDYTSRGFESSLRALACLGPDPFKGLEPSPLGAEYRRETFPDLNARKQLFVGTSGSLHVSSSERLDQAQAAIHRRQAHSWGTP